MYIFILLYSHVYIYYNIYLVYIHIIVYIYIIIFINIHPEDLILTGNSVGMERGEKGGKGEKMELCRGPGWHSGLDPWDGSMGWIPAGCSSGHIPGFAPTAPRGATGTHPSPGTTLSARTCQGSCKEKKIIRKYSPALEGHTAQPHGKSAAGGDRATAFVQILCFPAKIQILCFPPKGADLHSGIRAARLGEGGSAAIPLPECSRIANIWE